VSWEQGQFAGFGEVIKPKCRLSYSKRAAVPSKIDDFSGYESRPQPMHKARGFGRQKGLQCT
jgi:hypothetical protein